jgi:hypothetical protein
MTATTITTTASTVAIGARPRLTATAAPAPALTVLSAIHTTVDAVLRITAVSLYVGRFRRSNLWRSESCCAMKLCKQAEDEVHPGRLEG